MAAEDVTKIQFRNRVNEWQVQMVFIYYLVWSAWGAPKTTEYLTQGSDSHSRTGFWGVSVPVPEPDPVSFILGFGSQKSDPLVPFWVVGNQNRRF